MSELFLTLVNLSITAGWLVLCVLLLRLLLKKAPKWLRVALWGLVGLRLALPFSIESALSLIPSAETISPGIIYAETPAIRSGIPAVNAAVNPVIGGSFAPAVGASVNPLQIWASVAATVWLAGIAALLIYAAVSYLRLRGRVKTAVLLKENIYESENAASPFVLGFLRPRIYLPFGMTERAMENVVAHEKAHLSRRDHIIKPVGYLLLCVYWFNPLLWLAYILLCRDIELACDERVIKELGRDERADYSQALLSCSVPHRLISACPLAFGEVGVKERVKNVLSYRKPAFWIIIVAVAACAVTAVCFLTDPVAELSFDFEADPVYKAFAQSDVSSEAYYERKLSEAQIDELESRLSGLTGAKRVKPVNRSYVEYSIHADMDSGKTIYISFSSGSLQIQYDNRFYRVGDEDFLAYVKNVCTGVNVVSAALFLNDVIILSQKGDVLTWSDFDNYPYIETGSGLYIRVYEIDEQFLLMIGGGSTDEPPMYIRLVSKANRDDYIDIRTEDVADFIAARQSITDGPLTITSNGETVTPYQNFLWASDWTDDGWLAADGMPVIYELPEIAAELPAVTLAGDFELHYGDNASFSYLSVFDESYERIYHNVTLDQLNTLPAGTYYVSVVVAVQGEYIAEDEKYEAAGYECVIKLLVP